MPGYFDLNNRVALVTGASRGLGLAMAEALAEVGATVILNGRDANALETTADRMRDRGLKAETSAFNVPTSVPPMPQYNQLLPIIIVGHFDRQCRHNPSRAPR